MQNVNNNQYMEDKAKSILEVDTEPFSSTEWYGGIYDGCEFTLCLDNSEYGKNIRIEWKDEVPFESEPEGLEIEETIKNYYYDREERAING